MSSEQAPPALSPNKKDTLQSVHSPTSSVKKKLGELDGSLHISIHGNKARGGSSTHAAGAALADEDVNSITEGSDDFGFVDDDSAEGNNQDGGDDDDNGSFCDADETCSADKGFCRRGMSVGEEELTNFLVEFGDEIKSAAYYGDDGEVIEVPMALIPPEKQPKEDLEDNEGDDNDEDLIINDEDVEKILAPASQTKKASQNDGDVVENGA